MEAVTSAGTRISSHGGGPPRGDPDLLERGGLPLLLVGQGDAVIAVHGCHLPPDESTPSGREKTIIACPWGPPIIPGRNPSTQAPQPTGTAMYCLPSML